MTVLENSLREMFAAQAEHPPPVSDVATTVIRKGRRVRRGRAAVGGMAGVLALAGMVGGVVSLQEWWLAEPDTRTGVVTAVLPPSDPAPAIMEGRELPWRGAGRGVEVRLVNRVWTADGQRPLLRAAGLVAQAYRTPHGLVYGGDSDIRIRRGEEAVDLATGVATWLPSPDGERIAFTSDGEVLVAPLHPGGLGQAQRAAVPAGVTPVAFWGERVVLAGPDPGTFDVWDPSGPFEPAWTRDLVTVYGQVEGDLIVLVGGPGSYCVAAVPAGETGLRPAGAAGCSRPVPVTADGYGWLAPGGDWLALPSGAHVALVALSGDAAAAEPVNCPRDPAVTPIWWDERTLLTADDTGVVSCTVDGSVERLGRPDGIGSRFEFVPPLGGKVVSLAAAQTPK